MSAEAIQMETKRSEHEGYKHTPLGWIPEEWEVKEFADVFGFVRTNSLSREQLTESDTTNTNLIYNIHYGDIHSKFHNEHLDFRRDYVPVVKDEINLTITPDQLIADGDLIIADASEDYEGVGASVEVLNIEGKKVLGGLHTIVARDKKGETVIGYRTYILNNSFVRTELKKIATGISVYGISKSNVSKLKIPLPPLPEQAAIATLLSTWDKAIATTTRLIQQKQQRKKWLMQQLLTRKKRLKGFSGEWETKKLKEILIPTLRPIDKPSSTYTALGIRSHGKGTFLKPDFEPAKVDMDILYVVKENDLIVNITFAWEGAIAVAKNEDEGALVSHRFPTYNVKNGDVDFFRHFILLPKFRFMLDLISPGGAGRNRVLSKKDFLNLEFLLPQTSEQTAIASVLQAADKEIQLLQAQLQQLKEQKKGLMQVLLTGKKRIKITKP